MSKELKPTEEEQDFADDVLRIDAFCRAGDIDLEAVVDFIANKKSPWIPITPETEIKANTDVIMNHDGETDRGHMDADGQWWFQGYKTHPPMHYMSIPPIK